MKDGEADWIIILHVLEHLLPVVGLIPMFLGFYTSALFIRSRFTLNL